LAYAAGFFDGEGSITISLRKDTYVAIEVGVSQKLPAVLNWFHTCFGGNVYQSKQYAAQWKIFGGKAVQFLSLIEPYLIVKAPDCEEAIAAWDWKHDPDRLREIIAVRKERRRQANVQR
jgi:hypothetical protein